MTIFGTESSIELEKDFYDTSFITDYTGGMLQTADRTTEGLLTATIDLNEAREYQRSRGVFRDRRPDLYGPLPTLGGNRSLPARPA